MPEKIRRRSIMRAKVNGRRRSQVGQRRDRYDWLTLWVATIGLVVVAASTAITAYQAYIGRQAVVVALAQQRAWLKTEVKAEAPLAVWKEGGAVTYVSLSAANVGPVPAIGVAFRAKLIPTPLGDYRPEVPRSFFEVCEGRLAKDLGQTVFPGETVGSPLRYVSASTTPQDVSKVASDGKIGLILATCSAYLSGTDGAVHRTVKAYMVLDKSRMKQNPGVFEVSSSSVDLKNLSLEPIHLLNRAD
jgi:hypothetical protein